MLGSLSPTTHINSTNAMTTDNMRNAVINNNKKLRHNNDMRNIEFLMVGCYSVILSLPSTQSTPA